MNSETLHQALQVLSLISDLEYHASIGSTNDRALELARQGAPEGFVVVADTQTRGKGRRGKSWQDESGRSLLFTLLLRPSVDPQLRGLIGLALAVGAAEAVTELTGLAVRTKWPNDLVLLQPSGTPAKLAGILVEGDADFCVAGLGLNVGPVPPFAAAGLPAVGLAPHAATVPPREALLAAILRHFEPWYRLLTEDGARQVARAFRELDITLGCAVTLREGSREVTGLAVDLDATGALIVQIGAERHRFLAGEVSLSHTSSFSKDPNF
ncbi:biotin--[acetyl-CoA-carboxylase] ligase [bacterium]|nr:biotin--[acetyl-CoA-carboxylase] ligase [bacterium]